MNRTLIKNYIDMQPQKIVAKMDLKKNEIEYQEITQGQAIKEIRGDEEMSRAFLLTRLVNELGYLPERIEIEHEYTAGRPHTNTSRIDVIVRDASGNAFLFIECKSPDSYSSDDKDQIIEEQLYKVAGMERTEGNSVRYLVLYTTVETDGKVADQCIIIDTEKFPTFADWAASRNFSNTLPARYGKAQKTPYIKASAKDLETDFSNEMLNQLQTDLHNVLWGGGGTDDNEVFASLTNLILAKIQDEDEKEDGDTYDFQSMTFAKDGDEEFETNEQLFNRINALYRRALKSKHFLSEPIVLGASISPSDYDNNGDYCYISMATIKSWRFDEESANTVSNSYAESKSAKTVRKNDIILARSGEGTIGKVALITDEHLKGIFADFTMRIRLKDYDPEFAYYYFRTTYFQYLIEIFKKGLGNNTNIFPIVIREL